MIEVRIPKEIREYKPKFMLGLNVRQFVCLVLAILICVPLYLFGKDYLNEDLLSYLIILIAVPMMLIGFFNYNQMNFETFIVVYVKFMINNQRRKYQEVPVLANVRDMYLAKQRQDILDRLKLKKKISD